MGKNYRLAVAFGSYALAGTALALPVVAQDADLALTSAPLVLEGTALAISVMAQDATLSRGGLPSWVPAPGEITTLTVANGKLLNYWRAAVDPNYQAFYSKTIVNDYAGAVKNPYWGDYGCTMWFGSGHASGTNDNSVLIAEYGASGITFRRIVDATNWAASGGANEGAASIAAWVAFPWLESTIDAKPLSPHSWQTQIIQGPGDGGATYGTFWQAIQPASGQAGYNAIAAYKLPLTGMTANTATWARASVASDYPANSAAWGAPPLCAYVPSQQRIYLVPNSAGPTRWLNMTAGTYHTGSSSWDYVNHDGNPRGNGVMMYVESRDLVVLCYKKAGALAIQYADVTSTDPTVVSATVSGSPTLPTSWSTATWCPDNDRIIAWLGDTGAMHEVTIPATLTDPWVVERAAFGVGQTFTVNEPASNGNAYGKFGYDSGVKSIVYMPVAQHTGDDTVYVYRPRGT